MGLCRPTLCAGRLRQEARQRCRHSQQPCRGPSGVWCSSESRRGNLGRPRGGSSAADSPLTPMPSHGCCRQRGSSSSVPVPPPVADERAAPRQRRSCSRSCSHSGESDADVRCLFAASFPKGMGASRELAPPALSAATGASAATPSPSSQCLFAAASVPGFPRLSAQRAALLHSSAGASRCARGAGCRGWGGYRSTQACCWGGGQLAAAPPGPPRAHPCRS